MLRRTDPEVDLDVGLLEMQLKQYSDDVITSIAGMGLCTASCVINISVDNKAINTLASVEWDPSTNSASPINSPRLPAVKCKSVRVHHAWGASQVAQLKHTESSTAKEKRVLTSLLPALPRGPAQVSLSDKVGKIWKPHPENVTKGNTVRGCWNLRLGLQRSRVDELSCLNAN